MRVVFSPHTDDAIFSIGAHLSQLNEPVTIVSPMAGIPSDAIGRSKHQILRQEHDLAVKSLLKDGRVVNGDFLDDVYPPPNLDELAAWLKAQFTPADTVYVPLGIHHPDHILISDILTPLLRRRGGVVVYEELPYRLRYNVLREARKDLLRDCGEIVVPSTPAKEAALRLYASQTDEALIAELMTPEHLWR